MRIVNRLATLIAAGLLSCGPAFARPLDVDKVRPTGLTVNQAKRLLMVVLKHERVDMSDSAWWIDEPFRGRDGLYPGYRSFALVYSHPKNAMSFTHGHCAVNVLTGDVWVANSCKRISFPALTKLQHGISLRTGKKRPSARVARDDFGC
ncbi:hypothetical protein F2P45_17170 [Massilia sp. CCM 8733]|uniref:Uncharacterized protein n=1 Tax=Massilia mucilaginosa TaxID=2609282 RepID=A0ABX0NVI3_9BURK|nr:hypothetical protein [Massilia mucilaginosa]NHZ90740.1 hypothetical protein [Massilia mucilaginosa]